MYSFGNTDANTFTLRKAEENKPRTETKLVKIGDREFLVWVIHRQYKFEYVKEPVFDTSRKGEQNGKQRKRNRTIKGKPKNKRGV